MMAINYPKSDFDLLRNFLVSRPLTTGLSHCKLASPTQHCRAVGTICHKCWGHSPFNFASSPSFKFLGSYSTPPPHPSPTSISPSSCLPLSIPHPYPTLTNSRYPLNEGPLQDLRNLWNYRWVWICCIGFSQQNKQYSDDLIFVLLPVYYQGQSSLCVTRI
jgi:hypothetical protein